MYTASMTQSLRHGNSVPFSIQTLFQKTNKKTACQWTKKEIRLKKLLIDQTVWGYEPCIL